MGYRGKMSRTKLNSQKKETKNRSEVHKEGDTEKRKEKIRIVDT
jgi:hypothetical protein